MGEWCVWVVCMGEWCVCVCVRVHRVYLSFFHFGLVPRNPFLFLLNISLNRWNGLETTHITIS